MPIYTYRCRTCDHTFERNQRMSEPPLRDCPVCEGSVRRVINSVGIVFKGSGFYITDNRNGTGKAVNSTVNGQPAANGAQKNGTDGETTKVESPKESSSSTAATASKSESAPAAAPAPAT